MIRDDKRDILGVFLEYDGLMVRSITFSTALRCAIKKCDMDLFLFVTEHSDEKFEIGNFAKAIRHRFVEGALYMFYSGKLHVHPSALRDWYMVENLLKETLVCQSEPLTEAVLKVILGNSEHYDRALAYVDVSDID